MRRKAAGWLLAATLALIALSTVGAWAPGPSGGPAPERPASLQPTTHHLPLSTPGQQEGKAAEANLPFLFAVYAITWLAFFGYAFYLSRRQAELRQEVEALRQALQERRKPPAQGSGR